MTDKHLSIALLKAIRRGDRSPSDLAATALAHLLDMCPTCRAAYEKWNHDYNESRELQDLSRYDAAFDRVRARLRGEDDSSGTWELSRMAPPSDPAICRQRLGELLELAPKARLDRVKKYPERYSGPVLGDLLLAEATKQLPGKPEDAYAFASLARAVVQHNATERLGSEVYARALAQQGNALRAHGELRRAAELIEASRFLLKAQGGGNRLARAEIDRCEGTLRRAQRRFDEAEMLLARAALAYGMEGRSEEAAKTLLSLAITLEHSDEFVRAIELVEQAIEEFEEIGNNQLLLLARHNHTYYLMKTGNIDLARRAFEESADLYERFGDPLLQIRRVWLDANISRAENRLEAAEAGYKAVRDAFLSRGMGYDAALVALDLATLYAEQGRTAELKRIAEEIVPVFEAQDVHREAAAALMLFQDAVRTEQVTLGYVLELTRYLQRARLDPDLQFRIPA